MTDLKPWYAVATPHEDIREGRLVAAVGQGLPSAVLLGSFGAGRCSRAAGRRQPPPSR